MEVGDEVQVADLTGTVRRVITEGTVVDPLLGEVFAADPDDPVLVLDTPDGPMAAQASETKAAASSIDQGWDELVGLLAEHERAVETKGLPEWARPDGQTLKAVYGRGLRSWPGAGVTALSQQQWALARAKAFLDASTGQEWAGYARDVDLLPTGHPAQRPVGDD